MEKPCYKTALILAVIVVVFLNPSVAWTQPGPMKYNVSTSCLTEIRHGKKSCWGIVINFAEARLRKTIPPNELKVYEAKHGSNMIDLMTWSVSRVRKQL